MYRKIIFVLLVASTIVFPFTVFAEEQERPTVLTLDQCLEMAYANSQQLKAATQNVLIAKEAVKQAEAGFLATVNYQFSYTRLDEATPPMVPSEDVYRGNISVTQPLYTGGKLTYALQIAKTNLNKSIEEERSAKQNLTHQVKEAYYRAWLAEQSLIVAKSSYENLGHHVEQVEKLYKVGTSSKFDLLRAEVQHQSLKPQIITAENGLSLAKLSLATLIGFDKDKEFSVAVNPDTLQLPEQYNAELTDLLNQAFENRSELRQLQYGAELSHINTLITNAERKPNVGLTLSYEGTGDELNAGDWNKSWSLTLGVQGKIFDATIKPKVEAAKQNEELIAIQESALKDKIRLELQQALQGIKEALESIKANQAQMKLAQESLRMTQARFDAGMATTIDIMDAQLELDKASNGYYKGISDYLTALSKLDLTIGK